VRYSFKVLLGAILHFLFFGVAFTIYAIASTERPSELQNILSVVLWFVVFPLTLVDPTISPIYGQRTFGPGYETRVILFALMFASSILWILAIDLLRRWWHDKAPQRTPTSDAAEL